MNVHTVFAAHTDFPPSLEGQPAATLFSIFGLLLVELLVIEWLWRLLLGACKRRSKWHDPLTIKRAILVLLLSCFLIAGMPDLLIMMFWGDWSAETRQRAAEIDRMLDGFLFVPFSLAWLISRLSAPMIDYQLMREPLPINLWPTWHQLREPAKIGVYCFVIALAVTFIR